ncbi:MAG: hypothetical protein KGM44_00585 [bacterium]|nr:hypothetical protein [bacterium]
MFKRSLAVAALLAAAAFPAQAGAVTLFDNSAPPVPLKVSLTSSAGSPVSLGKVTADRDSDGNLTVTADYRSDGSKPIKAVRIRFEVIDPFGGQLGYFNGISQDPLVPKKAANMTWSSDRAYPIAATIQARVTDVAFADGTYWQAPEVPNPVIAAEHQRLLQVYRDGGLQALLKALGE